MRLLPCEGSDVAGFPRGFHGALALTQRLCLKLFSFDRRWRAGSSFSLSAIDDFFEDLPGFPLDSTGVRTWTAVERSANLGT